MIDQSQRRPLPMGDRDLFMSHGVMPAAGDVRLALGDYQFAGEVARIVVARDDAAAGRHSPAGNGLRHRNERR